MSSIKVFLWGGHRCLYFSTAPFHTETRAKSKKSETFTVPNQEPERLFVAPCACTACHRLASRLSCRSLLYPFTAYRWNANPIENCLARLVQVECNPVREILLLHIGSDIVVTLLPSSLSCWISWGRELVVRYWNSSHEATHFIILSEWNEAAIMPKPRQAFVFWCIQYC